MVIGDTAHQISRELFFEECCNMIQELISLVETVGIIVKFHTDDVKEYNGRIPALFPNDIGKELATHAAVFQIRKSSQGIEITVRPFT